MKVMVLLITSVFLSANVWAKGSSGSSGRYSVDIVGEFNQTSTKTTATGTNAVTYESNTGSGSGAGVLANVRLVEHFSISLGVLYTSRKMSYKAANTTTVTYNLTSYEVPVYFLGHFGQYFAAGLVGTYYSAIGDLTYDTVNPTSNGQSVTYANANIPKSDTAFGAVVQATIPVGIWHVTLIGNYLLGITNMDTTATGALSTTRKINSTNGYVGFGRTF